MESISQSVGEWGEGAKNLYSDVWKIQELLETAAINAKRSDYDPKGVDGKIAKPPYSSNTIKAIKNFQKKFMSDPDGLIEPGKNSLKKLNQIVVMGTPQNVSKPPPKAVIAGGLSFPLSSVPNQDYKKGGRFFGARRSKGKRKHAGCDLIAPEGTKIYAVDDGIIIRGPYSFYRGTYAIEVKHTNFTVRYCEIKKVAKNLRTGSKINKGQLIAYVGKMFHSSMLHLEIYDGTSSGRLTQRNNPPYQRRADLLDPTPYLDVWRNNLPTGG